MRIQPNGLVKRINLFYSGLVCFVLFVCFMLNDAPTLYFGLVDSTKAMSDLVKDMHSMHFCYLGYTRVLNSFSNCPIVISGFTFL